MKEKALECVCHKQSGILALLISLLEVRATQQSNYQFLKNDLAPLN
jgi:hypothetical protein